MCQPPVLFPFSCLPMTGTLKFNMKYIKYNMLIDLLCFRITEVT